MINSGELLDILDGLSGDIPVMLEVGGDGAIHTELLVGVRLENGKLVLSAEERS